jgi:hypothetical protein
MSTKHLYAMKIVNTLHLYDYMTITLPTGKFEEKILLVQIHSLGIRLMHNHNFLSCITTDWPQNCYFLNTAQLLVCKTGGFHGGDYEECRLLGCGAM